MNLTTMYKESNLLLSEVKLSRVWKHLTTPETVVGIITGFRGEFKKQDNIKRNNSILKTIRKEGYGFFIVDGSWIEDGERVEEDSIFIIGSGEEDNIKLKNLLIKISKEYDQDAFVFKPSGENSYQIINKAGKTQITFNKVSFNTLSDIYTKMRKTKGTFLFENAYTSGGFIDQLLHRHSSDD